jgi:hypothetical protein
LSAFLFDVRVDFSEKLPVQYVDIPVSFAHAYVACVRVDTDSSSGFSQWATVTVKDKGDSSRPTRELHLVVCRRSENGLTMLPADAGKFIACVKTGVMAYAWWAFFEVFERAAPGRKAAESSDSQPPKTTEPSSPPSPSPPPAEPDRMF